MKVLLTTLNSKFIHTALALRLLYVACKDRFDIDFKEYTIKDNLEDVIEDILHQNIDVLGISTYIWNVSKIETLVKELKIRKPNMKIILGGPEVSYEPEHFLKRLPIDYVLCGEGEVTLPALLEGIRNNEEVSMAGISYRKDEQLILNGIALNCDLSVLETYDSPYLLERDLPHLKNRVLYFESSRGCPYICQYCLSSLEKGLRFFSDAYIFKNLKALIDSGVKTVKFLDRSFNVHPEKALGILKFIVKHHQQGQQFQFEINADVLDQRIIDYVNGDIPKGLIRFEIGIQSTYDPTNKVVKRKQDFERLSEVITQLVSADKVDLHLDLIAGLPFESYERFKKSFDDVFTFRAKELQLGFLKLLRGTTLRQDADKYGYDYQQEAPYEIYSNDVMSNDEREEIHIAEEMLERYWNSGRFYRTLNTLFDHYVASPFSFFHEFGHFYIDQGFKLMGYQLDELFGYLNTYLNTKGIDLKKNLMVDYLSLSKVKPKKWWEATLTHEKRQAFIHRCVELDILDRELLFKYSLIEKIEDEYIVAIYRDLKSQVYIINEKEITG